VLGAAAFPDRASYIEHGIGANNCLTFYNQQIANRFFPVPAAF
jgi:hypothetical protein